MGIHAKYSAGRLVYYNSGNVGGIDYGTSSAEVSTATADRKFISIYTKTTAATGDSRAIYARLNLGGTTAGAGYGDAMRAYAYVTGTGYANATGMHSSVAIAAGATATGQSSGLRATFEAAAATRTLSGAVCALQLDSFVGANNTMPTVNAYIRCSKVGSVDFDHFLALPAAASNSTIFATHTTQTMTHSIRIIDDDGTPYFIMCCDAATNRGGAS
jgi:hypothetical protein